MRAVAFTMLARGSGPEQRTRLAVQWRQISCEYRGWGQVAGASLACGDACQAAGNSDLSGMPKAREDYSLVCGTGICGSQRKSCRWEL